MMVEVVLVAYMEMMGPPEDGSYMPQCNKFTVGILLSLVHSYHTYIQYIHTYIHTHIYTYRLCPETKYMHANIHTLTLSLDLTTFIHKNIKYLSYIHT